MAERFYANCPLAIGPVVLEAAEAHHLRVVCRLRPGDAVCLFNGDGRQYRARILSMDKRAVNLQVLAMEEGVNAQSARLEVAAPLPKSDRARFLIEKLTELGVTSFVPLRTGHSVVHAAEHRLEKLERYVIEACKQSGRNDLLAVRPLIDWGEYCCSSTLPNQRRLAHFGGKAKLSAAGCDAAVAVGPEGGFTAEEINLALSHGWQLVDLGPHVLRIETAALAMAIGARFNTVDQVA